MFNSERKMERAPLGRARYKVTGWKELLMWLTELTRSQRALLVEIISTFGPICFSNVNQELFFFYCPFQFHLDGKMYCELRL